MCLNRLQEKQINKSNSDLKIFIWEKEKNEVYQLDYWNGFQLYRFIRYDREEF